MPRPVGSDQRYMPGLDGLAAAAAHELGTPLSTIVLVSRELERTLADNPQRNAQAAGDIKTLREQTQRCRDILSKITQLSSTGAPFDRMKLSTLIEEAVAPHRDFGVEIKVRIAVAGSREPVGSRNPAILYGVGNILENALAACRDPVRVTICCQDAELEGRPALRVSVRDNGPGLTSEQRQRIFEPFFTTKTKGTGLGMAIAKRILEAHGGQLAVGPSGPPGAEILITLPRTPGP